MLFRRRRSSRKSRRYSQGYRLDPYVRRRVMRRDSWTCRYCDDPAEHVDHVHPRFYGGRDTMDNLVASCSPCNLAKGARILPGRNTAAKVAYYRKERLAAKKRASRRHQWLWSPKTGKTAYDRQSSSGIPWWVVVVGILLVLAAL